jgi:hypothetical protein
MVHDTVSTGTLGLLAQQMYLTNVGVTLKKRNRLGFGRS